MASDDSPLDPSILMQLFQQGGMPFPMGGMPPFGMPFGGHTDSETSSDMGRSRKYRDTGMWELQGAMSPFPATIIRTPNPVVPLKFEQEPNRWQGLDCICTETASLAPFEKDYVNSDVLEAHRLALDAYGCCTWREAGAMATEALGISPLCPEAYNVLAVAVADSYEEALGLYRKGEELGPQVLKPGLFEEGVAGKALWLRVPFRAYFRSLYGVANTLRKMGRYEEALAAYDKLLNCDGNWYNYSSYVNVMALYPFVVLAARGPKAVLDYMRNYQHTEDHFSYVSSSVYWTGAYVLADLLVSEVKGVSAKADGAKVTPEDKWAADGLDITRLSPNAYGNSYKGVKVRSLFCFCHTFPLAVDMLLGDKAMPAGLKSICSGSGKADAAASFAYTTGCQWRSQPTVMDRLRRYRNTYEVRALVQDLRVKGLTVDIQELRRYMNAPGGFHTHALEKIGDDGRVRTILDVLMDYPDGSEFTSDQLQVLKWLLAAGCPVHNTHPNRLEDQPLHMACYQGYGPEAVKALLAAGADPFRPNRQGLTAVAMTANQGNWREMQALLQTLPHLKTAKAVDVSYCSNDHLGPIIKKLSVPEALIVSLFHSSVLPCLEGFEKCMRCSNGIPHSPHADFFKFADVVVAEAGLKKLPKAVLEGMEGCAREMGPGSPWSKLHKYVLRAVDRCKKAPTAPQQPTPAAAAAAAPSSTVASSSKGSSSTGSLSTATQGAGKSSKKAAAAAAAAEPAGAPKQPGEGVRQCWGCGVKPGPGESLQKCSGCRKALYCSRPCQEAAWKAHKADCKAWQAERAAAKGSSKP